MNKQFIKKKPEIIGLLKSFQTQYAFSADLVHVYRNVEGNRLAHHLNRIADILGNGGAYRFDVLAFFEDDLEFDIDASVLLDGGFDGLRELDERYFLFLAQIYACPIDLVAGIHGDALENAMRDAHLAEILVVIDFNISASQCCYLLTIAYLPSLCKAILRTFRR